MYFLKYMNKDTPKRGTREIAQEQAEPDQSKNKVYWYDKPSMNNCKDSNKSASGDFGTRGCFCIELFSIIYEQQAESRRQRCTPGKTNSGRHKFIKTHPFCKLTIVEHLMGKLDHGNGCSH